MGEERVFLGPEEWEKELLGRLSEPFPATSVSWKPQTFTKDKSKALAVAFIDARDVMNRLDSVVGPFYWQTKEEEVCGQHITYLGVRNPFTGEWVWKSDAGFVGGAESDSEGEQVMAIKGTASDGLKRAGVRWSIGRYLYSLPAQWVAWDSERRMFKQQPSLPAWALPKNKSGVSSSTVASIESQNHTSVESEIVQAAPANIEQVGPEYIEGVLTYKMVSGNKMVKVGELWKEAEKPVGQITESARSKLRAMYSNDFEFLNSLIKQFKVGLPEALTWEQVEALKQHKLHGKSDPRWYIEEKPEVGTPEKFKSEFPDAFSELIGLGITPDGRPDEFANFYILLSSPDNALVYGSDEWRELVRSVTGEPVNS